MSPLEIYEKGLQQRVPEMNSRNVLASYPYNKYEYPGASLPVESPALSHIPVLPSSDLQQELNACANLAFPGASQTASPAQLCTLHPFAQG